MKSARVVVAGVGGLGGYSSLSLASAGVGRLTLIDEGVVEMSNLNRQVLYRDGDLGKAKAEIATERLSRVNPLIEIVPIRVKITEGNAGELIGGADVVVDGMDNFPGRLSLNAACFKTGLPFVYGGIYGLKGMVTTIIPGKTPCLACLTSMPPQAQEGVPVLGAIPALIGSVQALECVKLITGVGRPLAGKLLSFDGELGQWSSPGTLKRDSCPVCGGL